jgi:hypothetical protein
MTSDRLFALGLILWTVALVAGVVLLVPGQVPPCPEFAPVGLSDAERESIVRMCAERANLGPGPLIGVPIWIVGAALIAVLKLALPRIRRHRA